MSQFKFYISAFGIVTVEASDEAEARNKIPTLVEEGAVEFIATDYNPNDGDLFEVNGIKVPLS